MILAAKLGSDELAPDRGAVFLFHPPSLHTQSRTRDSSYLVVDGEHTMIHSRPIRDGVERGGYGKNPILDGNG